MERSEAQASVGAARKAVESQEYQRLKPNSLGLLGVVFMVVATAAPIAAMTANVPIGVGFGSGIGTPATYLLVTIILTIFAVGYVTMARYITATGAFYAYISHGLGTVVGMASGLLAVMAYIVFEAAVAGLFASFAQTTISDQLGFNVPWLVLAGLMLALNAFFGYRAINLTAKVLGVFLITEIAILALMAGAVFLAGGGPDGIPLSPVNPANAFVGAAPVIGFIFAFWSWVGFESTAIYGEESRDPKRIIPRATYIAVIGLGIFYTWVSWAAISGNGLSESGALAQSANPFALLFDPTSRFVGGWAVVVYQWLIVTGSFAVGLAFHNCAARYLYALGREGLIHRGLGTTHANHGSPAVASLTQTVIAAALVGLFWAFGQDPYLSLFALLGVLGTVSILCVQTICSFAVIAYFRRNHPEARHWWRTLVAPMIGGVAMAAVVVFFIRNLGVALGPSAETLFGRLIPFIVIGVFIIGLALALYLRSSNPERYALIGRVVYEDSTERPDTDLDGDGRGDHAPGAAPVRGVGETHERRDP